jgi:hypothetical protein
MLLVNTLLTHRRSPLVHVRQRNLTQNAMALQLHRAGNFTDAIALYDTVIASEQELAHEDETGGKRVDERFFMNRGDAYAACGAVRKVWHPKVLKWTSTLWQNQV